jgi:anion transporter
LKILDPGAIGSVLSVADPKSILATVATSYPTFLQTDPQGQYEYRAHLRDFLVGKFKQTVPEDRRKRLHSDFAAYFSRQGQWLLAIDHFNHAEEWQAALKLFESHGEALLDSEAPQTLLAVLDALPATVADPHGYLARLRGQVNARLGNLEGAIESYQAFLGHKQLSAGETIDVAQYYQELAELHRRNGELGEALGCLQMGATLVEGGNGDFDAVEALRSVENLQQRRGAGQEAVSWGSRAFNVAEKLRTARAKRLFGFNKKAVGLTLAIVIATVVWYLPPQAPLDEKGVHFLAIFLGIVALWAFEIFEEHVVAILLLLSWLILEIVPTRIALAGFSESSWFFALGVLGIGAAVTSTGLLYRVALQVLRVLPPRHKVYSFSLLTAGLFITPVFPENKGRIGIMAPLTQTISEALGYGARSNGSASLAFSNLVGFSQLTFTFLTGATYCLVGWSLLPANARANFGWITWFEAALPAALVTVLLFYFAIQICFPSEDIKIRNLSGKTLLTQMEILGTLTSGEWISIGVIALAAFGWLGKPLHGISEAWVALGALAIFLVTGLLDRKGLRNNIDWGYLLFLGVVSAMDDVMRALGVDRWLSGFVAPVISAVSFSPLLFLFVVALMVYGLRFLLKKSACVVLILVTLIPMAQQVGIHPGVLLLTILIAIEAWFLPYQTDSYQIAYYSTDEKAFSHAQGRKLMIVKFLISFLSIAVSVPYWRMLGFIR